jgi:predicted amidophosphoribosyltransferase
MCNRILDTASRIPFCPAYLEALTQTPCAHCGRPIVAAAAAKAMSLPSRHPCRGQDYAFDFARSFGAYTPRMSRAILRLKDGNVVPLGVWFARFLADLIGRQRVRV